MRAVIRAYFRFPESEYTVIGLRNLLEMNREVVKKVFLSIDDREIRNFIKENKAVFGLDQSENSKRPGARLAMWN